MAKARAASCLDTLLAKGLVKPAGESSRRLTGQRRLRLETLESRIAPSALLSMPLAAPRPVAVDGVDAIDEISVAPAGTARRSLNAAKRDVGAATFVLPPAAPDWFEHEAECEVDNRFQHRRQNGELDVTPRDRERVGRAFRSGMSDLSVDLSAWTAPGEQPSSAAKSPARNLLLQQPMPWHNSSAPSAIGGSRGDVGGGSVGGRGGVPAASVVAASVFTGSQRFLGGGTTAGAFHNEAVHFASVATATTTTLEGNTDDDADVDGADFLAWQRTLGGTDSAQSSLAAWQANFGATSSTDPLAPQNGAAPGELDVFIDFGNPPNQSFPSPRISLTGIVEDPDQDGAVNTTTPTLTGSIQIFGPLANTTNFGRVTVDINGDRKSISELIGASGIAGINGPNGGVATFDFQLSALSEGLNDLEIKADSGIVNNRVAGSEGFQILVDTLPPTADIVDVADPRNTPVSQVNIVFSEEVAGVNSADFQLTRNGNPITVPNTLSGSGANYSLDLTDATQVDGEYVLTLVAVGSGITDLTGNTLSANSFDEWTIDTTPPASSDPPVLDVNDDTGRSNTDAVTRQQSNLTFSAVAAPNATVVFEIRDGAAVVAMQPGSIVGNRFVATFAAAIPAGNYAVVARATNPAGASVVSNPLALTIDVTAPVAPGLELLADTGLSANDNVTLDVSPDFALTGTEIGATVELRRNDTIVRTEQPPSSDRLTAVSDPSVAHSNAAYAYQVRQIDAAGNEGSLSAPVEVLVDAQPPRLTNPMLHPDDNVSGDSNLPITVTNTTNPRIRFNVDEEVFVFSSAAPPNNLSIEVFVNGASKTPTPLVVPFDPNDKTIEAPLTGLSPGANQTRIEVRDAAGNLSATQFTFLVSSAGDSTAAATPVFTSLFDVNDARDELGNKVFTNSGAGETEGGGTDEAFFPWQMTFDNKTQTVWLSMESTHDIAQFDPATGLVRVYDLGLINSQAGLSNSVRNPHGAFFDFNTHHTPRVWFVHRNGQDGSADPENPGPARLSYMDLVTNELVSYDFADAATAAPLGALTANTTILHAVVVDELGDVWAVSLGSNSILQFDFDRPAGTSANLNTKTATLRVHPLPASLDGNALDANDFEPHALEVIVDDVTGEQYVWFIAEGGSGRIGLLRPASSSNDGQDRWMTWNVPEAAGTRGTFVKIDDRETPGIPQDDTVFATFPTPAPGSSKSGIIYELDPNLEEQAGDEPIDASIRLWEIPATPGASASLTAKAAINQPFADRSGELFFIDRLGGIGRFSPEALMPKTSGAVSTGNWIKTTPPQAVTIQPTPVNGPVANADNTAIDLALADQLNPNAIREGRINPTTKNAFAEDRSKTEGLAQYELAGPRTNLFGGPGGGQGPFRGALNATNVLYGSLAQNGMLSTTVFAETSRRQMAVVPSPTAGNLALRGRMAFQVLRDGSLILTARGDGSLLDKQMNLSDRLKAIAPPFSAIAIDGDTTAVVDGQGRVNVLARTASGELVHFRYTGAWNSTDGLFDPTRWTVNVIDVPNGNVLAGEPVAFAESASKLAIFATTADGHLLRFYLGEAAFTDLTQGKPGFEVYASPGIVRQGNDVFVYASNQKGDLIEYSYAAGASASLARVVTATPFAAPAGGPYQQQTARDVRVFQDIEVVLDNGVRHVYATDGNSRLVHIEANGARAGYAENVSQVVANSLEDNTIVNDTTTVTTGGVTREVVTQTSVDVDANDQAFGQFPFQEPYVGRVYSGLEVLVGSDGRHFIYGTEGSSLILFIRGGDQPDDWRVSNLTNDTYSIYGDAGDRTDPRAPAGRVPANAVFGSPGGYIEDNGDRHIFQINAEGEVVEYYIVFNRVPSGSAPRFHTQNINLRTGFSPTELLHQT